MKSRILCLIYLALLFAGCATVREEWDVGAGKKAIYITYTNSRQEGYNQTCRDVWQDGKLVDAKCAQGPSLLQSATAGTTQGALGAYLLRPDRFTHNDNDTLVNQQEQSQSQHQRSTSRARSNSESSAASSSSSMPMVTIVGTPPTVPMD